MQFFRARLVCANHAGINERSKKSQADLVEGRVVFGAGRDGGGTVAGQVADVANGTVAGSDDLGVLSRVLFRVLRHREIRGSVVSVFGVDGVREVRYERQGKFLMV